MRREISSRSAAKRKCSGRSDDDDDNDCAMQIPPLLRFFLVCSFSSALLRPSRLEGAKLFIRRSARLFPTNSAVCKLTCKTDLADDRTGYQLLSNETFEFHSNDEGKLRNPSWRGRSSCERDICYRCGRIDRKFRARKSKSGDFDQNRLRFGHFI